jgi:high-affinity iron transporter
LREGFEAVLVVIALMAVLRKLKAPKAMRWTHLGWSSAIAAGFATWFVSERFINISGAGREVMEGVVGLIAVVMLVYMGIWLHGQGEIRKWAAFVNQQARQAVTENRYMTFFGIAFLSVYREAFETVLFYRALALETTKDTQGAMLLGLLAGAVAIGALTWAMLKAGARIPFQRFFQISSALIFALTIVIMGKGTHALQEAGWFSITSFPVNLRIDILGIFPTYETMGAQAGLLAVLILIRWVLNYSSPRRQAAASQS